METKDVRALSYYKVQFPPTSCAINLSFRIFIYIFGAHLSCKYLHHIDRIAADLEKVVPQTWFLAASEDGRNRVENEAASLVELRAHEGLHVVVAKLKRRLATLLEPEKVSQNLQDTENGRTKKFK